MRPADPDECWGWRGSRNPKGYGRLGRTGGKSIALAHRVSWEIHFGEIPEGLCVLHRCDNPPCTNPSHLWLGSVADNQADMREKGRAVYPPRHSGETHPTAKLTQAQVDQIRARYVPRVYTYAKLAQDFGVHPGTIKRILANDTWATRPATES